MGKVNHISGVEYFKRYFRIVLIVTFFLNYQSILKLTAQTSKDNYTGNWTDNSTWIGGMTPGLSSISSTVTINGFVIHYGDLNFSNGTLVINDTLIIFGGSLVFDNLSGGGSDPTSVDISIVPGGVLIVFGDMVTGNKVDLNTEGKLAVTGQLTAQGGNKTEYLDSGGEIFLYNPPDVKGGRSFEPLECPSPPTSYHSGCNYGDSIDASFSSIAPLLKSGGFSISPSTPIILSCNDSVVIRTQSGADSYSWYNDGVLIDEGTYDSIYVTEPGNYYVDITVDGYSWSTSSVSVSTSDTESPDISCPSNVTVCEGETVELGEPIVSDNCSIDYVTNDAPVNYSLGITTVKWKVYDLSGNNASCNQTVTVNIRPDSVELHRIPNE